MFLLESIVGYFLLAALVSAVTLFVLLLAAYFVLRAKGLFFIRKKRTRTAKSTSNALPVHESEDTISEQVLVAIISAAVAAMGEERNTRFRVVSFRRMK